MERLIEGQQATAQRVLPLTLRNKQTKCEAQKLLLAVMPCGPAIGTTTGYRLARPLLMHATEAHYYGIQTRSGVSSLHRPRAYALVGRSTAGGSLIKTLCNPLQDTVLAQTKNECCN